MCGRFALVTEKHVLEMLFQIEIAMDLSPRLNIAPTQEVLAVRSSNEGLREAVFLKWGLVPQWAQDKTTSRKLINARGETVAVKPSFKKAFRLRRVLIPASGFYEWKKEGKRKMPYLIGMNQEKPFALAGLWERWKGKDGSNLQTCAIITTRANSLLLPVHHRMPVIISRENYISWLDPETDHEALLSLLEPYPSRAMTLQRANPV